MVASQERLIRGASLVQQRYVEVIADLLRRNGRARTCDIAEALDVSLPAVSEVVRRLVSAGLLSRKSRHEIVVTPRGRGLVRQLERRQNALQHFMTDILGFEERAAETMACQLEHSLDASFVERIHVLDTFLDLEGNAGVKQAWMEFRQKHAKRL